MISTLNIDALTKSDMIEQCFNFWFKDSEHIRSPFPAYIHYELRRLATMDFLKWVKQLNIQAKKDINDEILVEKFEEVLFEKALTLVLSEDEKITINYPFLPRINDVVSAPQKKESSVVLDRSIVKDGDVVFLSLKMKSLSNDHLWESRIELPKIGF